MAGSKTGGGRGTWEPILSREVDDTLLCGAANGDRVRLNSMFALVGGPPPLRASDALANCWDYHLQGGCSSNCDRKWDHCPSAAEDIGPRREYTGRIRAKLRQDGAKAGSDKVRQLNNSYLYDDTALGISLRGVTSSTKLRTMVQPALMTALKPESVRMPPGVATMTLTANTEENSYTKNMDNISSHPGANRTGRVKTGGAAPAPTITTTKKRGNQTIFLPHDDNRKARRTHRAQTRDMTLGGDIYDEDQGKVTSQSDMNVTPQRRGYMRSSLQRSCYVERHSGEGRAPSVWALCVRLAFLLSSCGRNSV